MLKRVSKMLRRVAQLLSKRKNKTKEKSSSASVRSIFKNAITEDEKIGVSMKIKAQKEAEAIAESIITRANQDAQEIKRSAQTAAQGESEDIRSVANSSLRSIFKDAITEAEKTGASIKMKAQKEAEAIAESIITRANQDAQEIKKSAQTAAQRESEDIISAAKRKAESMEAEAKQKALLAVLKASEEIREEITEEYKSAYSRLSSYLQNLTMNEVQKIEMDFKEKKDKREKLWESRNFAPREYENELSRIYGAAAPPLETSAPAGKETDIARKKEKPDQLEEKGFVKGVEQPASHQEESSLEVMEQPSPRKEETIIIVEEKIEQSQLQEPATVSRPAKRAMEEPLERPSLSKEDSDPLYYGEVELFIAMPVDLKIVAKLDEYLETMSEIKVLYSGGSMARGTTMVVKLDKPMPLISMLSKIPDIQVIPEFPQKGALMERSPLMLKTRTLALKRIKISAKEAQSV